MNVSFAPYRSSYVPLYFSRSLTTRVMSTSNTEWTCADVRRDSIMCSAIFFRIADIGPRSTRAPPANEGPAAFVEAVGAAAPPAPPAATKSRMSFLVTRPPEPVPGTRPGSIPCSAAIFRTTGETNAASSEPAGGSGSGAFLGAAGRGGEAGAALGGSAFAGAGRGSFAVAAAPASVSITATTWLTGTVSPSLFLISTRTPAAGEGISASTLSVEISNSGSSLWTLCPIALIHFVIVPSAIDSPIWGITTSTRMRDSLRSDVNGPAVHGERGLAHGLRQRRMGVDRLEEGLRGRLEVQGRRGLRDQLGGMGPDDVDSED